MRAVLCALVCNCRHTLRADDDERLVAAALEHLRRYHPVAPFGEERIREVVSARAYEIEYPAAYPANLGTEEIQTRQSSLIPDRKPWDGEACGSLARVHAQDASSVEGHELH